MVLNGNFLAHYYQVLDLDFVSHLLEEICFLVIRPVDFLVYCLDDSELFLSIYLVDPLQLR